MIYRLVKGATVPALGFGTFKLRGAEGIAAIRYALDLGYRHIDTAIRYENEDEVGQALAESGLDRSDIFLTTKLRHVDLADGDVQARTTESLQRLRTDYVDLLLMHWPHNEIPFAETWRALCEVRAKGQAHYLGVSNFPAALMRQAVEECGADLLTNQIEYHPFLSQTAVMDFARAHDILVTAAVPLARGAINDEPVLRRLAEEHRKTPAQITLRWLLQQDQVVAIPKSGQRDKIRENFELFDFSLTAAEMAAIDALRGNLRLVNPTWAPQWDAA